MSNASGVTAWAYYVGAAVGDLGTTLTLWVYMQTDASLAAELSSNLRGLAGKVKTAPEGANKDLVASLTTLGGMAKEKYTRPDVEKIASEAAKAMREMLPPVDILKSKAQGRESPLRSDSPSTEDAGRVLFEPPDLS